MTQHVVPLPTDVTDVQYLEQYAKLLRSDGYLKWDDAAASHEAELADLAKRIRQDLAAPGTATFDKDEAGLLLRAAETLEDVGFYQANTLSVTFDQQHEGLLKLVSAEHLIRIATALQARIDGG
jgi:hypothetical protein